MIPREPKTESCFYAYLASLSDKESEVFVLFAHLFFSRPSSRLIVLLLKFSGLFVFNLKKY